MSTVQLALHQSVFICTYIQCTDTIHTRYDVICAWEQTLGGQLRSFIRLGKGVHCMGCTKTRTIWRYYGSIMRGWVRDNFQVDWKEVVSTLETGSS